MRLDMSDRALSVTFNMQERGCMRIRELVCRLDKGVWFLVCYVRMYEVSTDHVNIRQRCV